MKLDDLCEVFGADRFPGIGVQEHPDRDSVIAARSKVTTAVVDDEFLADCIAWELRRLKDDRLRRGLVPFFAVPNLGILFAFGYWPPGGTPGPHEHTAWTITAVCRNELEVLTYDREESYRRQRLIAKNRFPAVAGRVGFIYEPCIHEPRNTSREWSLSLHVTSPRDGQQLSDYAGPLPGLSFTVSSPSRDDHPYARVIVARYRRKFVHQLARILASMDVPQSNGLLEQCFDLGSSETRKWIDQAAPQLCRNVDESQWLLARTHKDLVLSYRYENEMVALDAETGSGPVEEFLISNVARNAIEFVTREPIFDVRTLPGSLSDEEQTAIADMLEETGLFTRVEP